MPAPAEGSKPAMVRRTGGAPVAGWFIVARAPPYLLPSVRIQQTRCQEKNILKNVFLTGSKNKESPGQRDPAPACRRQASLTRTDRNVCPTDPRLLTSRLGEETA